MSRERLEEIKSTKWENLRTSQIIHVKWLIEQAERVRELETVIEQDKRQSVLEGLYEQNNRYREALERIAYDDELLSNTDDIIAAKEALEE